MIKFDRYAGGKHYAVTFSYDDGVRDDIRLVEIFNKYGAKCTFNLFSANVESDKSNCVRREEIKSVYAGHEIACHAYHHPHLERMTIKDQYDELIRDRETLEKYAGTIVRGMAFPFGTYNSDTLTAMKTAGIEYGRTTASTMNLNIPDGFMTWHPTCHHNDSEKPIEQLIYNIEKAPWRAGGLLYIWGHSYEFMQKDAKVDFDEMERRVARLAEYSYDIWFATNVEIMDYLNACKQLKTSADGTKIYNPTQVDVWLSNGDEPLCVGAGQTVTVAP
ncbi:MAG: polysaccharide deacetylase family protein [Clostridia bacterium]|nr:polysaccharide deacetylase family protein [Clostridia bacterium]